MPWWCLWLYALVETVKKTNTSILQLYSSKARAITNTGEGYPVKSDTLKRMILTYAKNKLPYLLE